MISSVSWVGFSGYYGNCVSHGIANAVVVFLSSFVNVPRPIELRIRRSICLFELSVTSAPLSTARLPEWLIWALAPLHTDRDALQLDFWAIRGIWRRTLLAWRYCRLLHASIYCYNPASWRFLGLVCRRWCHSLDCFFFFKSHFHQLFASELLFFGLLFSFLLCLFFRFLLCDNVLAVVRASCIRVSRLSARLSQGLCFEDYFSWGLLYRLHWPFILLWLHLHVSLHHSGCLTLRCLMSLSFSIFIWTNV